MYAIYEKAPIYDNRDGFAGNSVRQVPGYVYETEALAHRKLPSGYDEDGQSLEVTYFVADVSDPWRRPIARPAVAVDYADDIPF